MRKKDDEEINLIVERPGKPLLLIEIKSSDNLKEADLGRFRKISGAFLNAEKLVVSQTITAKKYGDILLMRWKYALKQYFFD